MKRKDHFVIGVSACVLLALTACTPTHTIRPSQLPSSIPQTYAEAAAIYLTDGKPNYNREDLLEILRAGKAFHDAGMWRLSNEAFDLAHEKLSWKEDTIDTPAEVANLIGTTITNGAMGAYQGKIFEGGFISYYKAINTLMLGDEQNAHAEFNGLAVRQQNALDQLQAYAGSVESKSRDSIEANKDKNLQSSLEKVKPKTAEGLSKLPDGLDDSYIRNASGDILDAVFRATSTFKQDKQVSMIDKVLNDAGTGVVTADARAMVDALRVEAKRNHAKLENKVIVIYEDGSGPGLKEFRVDLPVFIATKKVLYSGFALPSFEPGRPATGALRLAGSGVETVVVTDLNRLAGLEFKKAYQGIVAKSVVSAVIKTAAQYAVNQQIDKKTKNQPLAGLLMKIGTAVVQHQLTKADVRAWDNLPNTIQMAIVDHPASGQLELTDANGQPLETVTLPEGGNVLVLVHASPNVRKPAVYTRQLGFDGATTTIASR